MPVDSGEAAAITKADDDFEGDVIAGLSHAEGQKRLPSRYLYDERGCDLFERICDLPEYYLTRTELAIMRRDAANMASVCGPHCRLVELGSGSSIKTTLLLDQLKSLAMYVPVDIAPEYLEPSIQKINKLYPDLPAKPVCANFTEPFEIPEAVDAEKTVVYFPGSTIGNFTRPDAVKLLKNMGDLVGYDGGILVGMDLKKDADQLEAAYNDAAGVSAQFTNNLLVRIQRELDADVDLDQFEHFAWYNVEMGRIEIYLRSNAEQSIRIGEHVFAIADGELINTEYSYKYSLDDAQQMATDAGLTVTHVWLDEANLFGVFYFARGDESDG